MPAQRADARRNRAAILSAAWALFGRAAEILGQVDGEAFLGAGRAAILDAGRPLLADAQCAGEVRSELSLEQVLELVLAVAAIRGPVDYVEPILQTALDGLLGPTADRPDERS